MFFFLFLSSVEVSMLSTCCYLQFLHWRKAHCAVVRTCSRAERKPHMELFIALGDVSSSILMAIICRWLPIRSRYVVMQCGFGTRICLTCLYRTLRFSPIYVNVWAVAFRPFLTTCIGMTQSSCLMHISFLYEYILKDVVLHVSGELEQAFECKNWCRWKSKYVWRSCYSCTSM